ncbi:YcnI family copper-binding membrane protein [Leifsonia sp. AG29]|uniref:YcnI family copper-binding membrane protein n=1 Tax=Leifsonia sp. AG29 TaxID=2598860 RepID=UPI00131E823A|nr:YcnI family protein [Leifsonia sp. AG29]
MKKTTLAASVAATAAALVVLAAPLAASAHVEVAPDQAQPGSYVDLTFDVPTESATAGTVKLVVDLPTDKPFTSVSYLPIPGWTTTVDTEPLPTPVKTDDGTITKAPIRVTWTAQSGVQVAPGQFQKFTVSAGAVPETGRIALPTHQYYSDGTVVDWTDPTPASGAEPEHPAPTLFVQDAKPAEKGDPLVATATPAPLPASTTAGGMSTAVSIGLGIAGLALGAIALVVAVLALTRRGRVGTAEGGDR